MVWPEDERVWHNGEVRRGYLGDIEKWSESTEIQQRMKLALSSDACIGKLAQVSGR